MNKAFTRKNFWLNDFVPFLKKSIINYLIEFFDHIKLQPTTQKRILNTLKNSKDSHPNKNDSSLFKENNCHFSLSLVTAFRLVVEKQRVLKTSQGAEKKSLGARLPSKTDN